MLRRMLKRIFVTFYASLWAVGAGAGSTHDDEVATYATVVAVSQIASDRCPDILVLADAIPALGAILHIAPTDQMGVQLEIRANMKAFSDQVNAAPEGWCEEVLDNFGPEGSKMPGLLKRR